MQPYQHLDRVYCAGPLFNERERQEMVEIADVLEDAGFDPWGPHRDGMEFAQVHPYLVSSGYDYAYVGQLLHEAVFALDVYQVMLGCGSLVCNLNGRVPDEGAVSETSMAWSLGKPIVLYKDDVRTKIEGRDNPLVVGLTDFRTIKELRMIGPALQDRLDELDLDPEFEHPFPHHLQEVLRAGDCLWSQLDQMGHERPAPEVAEIILELFGSKSAPA
ncbi:MAG: nucleoside 2-deoxyribosyltransferase [Planctomycetales bacterium]